MRRGAAPLPAATGSKKLQTFDAVPPPPTAAARNGQKSAKWGELGKNENSHAKMRKTGKMKRPGGHRRTVRGGWASRAPVPGEMGATRPNPAGAGGSGRSYPKPSRSRGNGINRRQGGGLPPPCGRQRRPECNVEGAALQQRQRRGSLPRPPWRGEA